MRQIVDTGWRGMALTGLLSLNLFGFGCGGDDSGDDGADRIKIGMMVEFADVRDTQTETAVALLAVRDINNAGGIRIDGVDHEIELVGEDHGADPAIAVSGMANLQAKGVTATVGPPWSSLALGRMADHSDGASLRARDYDMLLVSPTASSAAITDLADDGLQWRTIPSDSVQGAVAAKALLDEGIKTASILHRDEPWGQGLASVFAAAFEAGGGQVLATVGYDVSGAEILDVRAHSYDSELTAVFAGSPEAVLLFTFDESFQVTNRVALGGYLDAYANPPRFFGSDGNFGPDLLNNGAPEVLRTLHGTVPFTNVNSSAYGKFAASAMTAEVDIAEASSPNRYDALFLIALAMQRANSTRADDVKAALRGVSTADADDVVIEPGEWAKAKEALLAGKGINYDGASGAIEFSAEGDPTVGTYSIWKVQEAAGGAFEFDLSELVDFDLSAP